MDVILWGVRGSVPNSNSANLYYGTNTPCVELRLPGGGLLVFDAGTGICSLSKTLPETGEAHIVISHVHTDHVHGLNFFQPFFQPGWVINLYMPEQMKGFLDHLFDTSVFPVSLGDLQADIRLHPMVAGKPETISVNGQSVVLEAFAANHPGGGFGYRATYGDKLFCYGGDHEITDEPAVQEATRAMLRGASVAVVDATWHSDDRKCGWGHSAWEDWIEPATDAGVGTLIFSHHSQDRKDQDVDRMVRDAECLQKARPGCPHLIAAREGMRIYFDKADCVQNRPSNWLQQTVEELSLYREESTLLDRILHKIRDFTSADAGTIFLVEGDELVFAYSQNDTLNPEGSPNKSAYVNLRMPLSTSSIAGYTAVTGKSLNLPDVYNLEADVPYGFNKSFDKETGYTTRSVITVPLANRAGDILGVVQLINSIAPDGAVQPFSAEVAGMARILAREAAGILELGHAVRSTIVHLLRIAILHDPYETGAHAERVGSIAAELYQRWAEKNDLPPEKIRHYKGQLRLASMLHDIGKVGISDKVLKKPGKLTDEEFAIMRNHAVYGADLFLGDDKDIMLLAREISLHHHQKWNGKGYPLLEQGAIAGEDIPLAARITAIADVFDALVSPRCYKNAWTFEKAINLLREEAGQHFDPELVTCFLELGETVPMIYKRFPDKQEEESVGE